ncbi:helix-turn-helix domain-containing protein [Bacillus sp. WC2507]|uniref:helix-turn-helix domain-containing protein n=1 Tax=Bacillus sp. WC2507 TaxID=3461404 RepID=UPI00404206CF
MLQPVDVRQWVHDNVMTTPEAIEILGISRARLSHLIKKGKITPIKKQGCTSFFLREDLEKKLDRLIKLRKHYRPYEN